MSSFASDYLGTFREYEAGEQPAFKKYIKLNTNENPYPPSESVKIALKEFNCDDLRLYPDPEFNELRQKLANLYDIDKENIFVGNGSDEVLSYAFLAFFKKMRPVLWGDVTYSFYNSIANLFQINYKEIQSDDNFKFDSKQFCEENDGIIIAHPNAPTGIETGVDFIEEIVKINKNKVVLVDEAYVDFGAQSALPLTRKYKNLLIVHTFSKSRCFAGMRVGYAVGNKELIDVLFKVKNCFNSYPVNMISQKLCIAALNDQTYYNKVNEQIITTREHVRKKLVELGFRVLESKTNFLFVTSTLYQANYLYNQLKNAMILVRHFKKKRIDNYLRISIGTDDEMNILLMSLKKIIES